MILSKEISIKMSMKTITHFRNLGYVGKINDIIQIKPIDLPKGSHQMIDVKCDVCDNEKTIMYQKYVKNINNGGFYACSSKCAQEKVKNTSNEKFGSDYYTQTKDYKKSYKKTVKEKYGVEHHTQSKMVKYKHKQSCLNKYNVDNASKSDKIKDKIKNTFIEKYGVDNISKLDYIKEKISIKNIENSEQRFLKTKNTLIEKYGVDNISKLISIKNKKKNTNIEKYGVENVLLLDSSREKAILNKLTTWKNGKMIIDNNIIDIDINEKIIKYKCKYNHLTNINYKTYYNRLKSHTIICTECNPCEPNKSGLETDLLNFIIDNYKNEIITNSKSIINPYELDIYLPELKLAFEFNGVYWHNELNKSSDYHKMKSDLCDKKEIQLIHIYEDDWIYKQDIVKSMIINKLKQIQDRIYARKTTVKEITDNNLIRTFLNENHIQGFIGSSIKLGLFHNDELVSLMTFGKLRKPLNSKSKNEKEYEMLRFCNKLNTNVIGGASKLFTYFLRNYSPLNIISYADRSHSNGNLYKQLGFKLDHITSPNYYYVIDNIRNHRFNFRKDILVKQGYDPTKSEHEIMLERKIYRIYNSGNYKFSFNQI